MLLFPVAPKKNNLVESVTFGLVVSHRYSEKRKRVQFLDLIQVYIIYDNTYNIGMQVYFLKPTHFQRLMQRALGFIGFLGVYAGMLNHFHLIIRLFFG